MHFPKPVVQGPRRDRANNQLKNYRADILKAKIEKRLEGLQRQCRCRNSHSESKEPVVASAIVLVIKEPEDQANEQPNEGAVELRRQIKISSWAKEHELRAE
jgi:hypothetical protein